MERGARSHPLSPAPCSLLPVPVRCMKWADDRVRRLAGSRGSESVRALSDALCAHERRSHRARGRKARPRDCEPMDRPLAGGKHALVRSWNRRPHRRESRTDYCGRVFFCAYSCTRKRRRARAPGSATTLNPNEVRGARSCKLATLASRTSYLAPSTGDDRAGLRGGRGSVPAGRDGLLAGRGRPRDDHAHLHVGRGCLRGGPSGLRHATRRAGLRADRECPRASHAHLRAGRAHPLGDPACLRGGRGHPRCDRALDVVLAVRQLALSRQRQVSRHPGIGTVCFS